MNSLSQMPVLLCLIGVVLLIVEFAVLGFSTLFLIFVSLACFGTAALQWLGLMPEDFVSSSASIAIQTALFAALLWRPLRRQQAAQQATDDQPSSLEGIEFRLNSPLSPTSPSSTEYSGIEWRVELDASCDEPLAAGTAVVVTRASVGKLLVRPAA